MDSGNLVTTTSYLAESRVPQILIGSILPTVIVTIFVFARFYSRLIILKSWGLDDSLICVSWVVTLPFTILTCLQTKYGAGRHMAVYETTEAINMALKLSFVARVLYQVSLAVTKLGICAFYHRVFQDHTSRILVYLMTGFISITSISLLFAAIFQCHPIAAAWSANFGLCFISIPQAYALGITSIAADILMLLFVIPRILGLKLPLKQKVSCLAIVSLSVLSIVAAAIRLDRLLWTAQHPDDLQWNSYDIGIWYLVEVDVGLFCASAPAIKPLLRKIIPGFLSSLEASTRASTRHTRTIGTIKVRHQVTRHSDVLELGSQTDFIHSPNEVTRPKGTWLDERVIRKTSFDSDAAILDGQSSK